MPATMFDPLVKFVHYLERAAERMKVRYFSFYSILR